MIDQNPAAAIRSKVHQQEQLPSNLKTVCCHRVLHFSTLEQECVVDMCPMAETVVGNEQFCPMTLHPDSFPSKFLINSFYEWIPKAEVLLLPAPHVAVPEHLSTTLQGVVTVIASCPGGVAEDWLPGGEDVYRPCLQWLKTSDFISGPRFSNGYPCWQFTEKGRRSMLCGLGLSSAKRVVRRADLEDLKAGVVFCVVVVVVCFVF